ncbi:hypothetical protein GXB85_08840 [Cellulomonas sp. APG4]|uniref:hypothetical protein n=1 Tax=Cellulomonas sp. APG4 TaxID=1538656 RepID=UPI0013793C0C|nr:hypothetical protein [Cellulomonas sp. APG4]NCT91052.1 hypothetical protein [Cellulomonas sp. APG4]
MDRPAGPTPSADEHWAPEHLVVDREALAYAGRLLVERDDAGQVLTSSPLEGMAAVEQRYPAWALGPFGRVEPERALPSRAGVFALVQGGAVRYVGSSGDLERTFSARGIGQVSRRDAQQARNEERCRLNRLVVAEARAGRTVDLYVLLVEATGLQRLSRAPGRRAEGLAARLARATQGAWHLPR